MHEVSWCSFTRLKTNQWLDIRVSQGQGQRTKPSDDLCKSQRLKGLGFRLKGLGFRPMDGHMIKQNIQSRFTTPIRVLEVNGMTCVVSQGQGVLEDENEGLGGIEHTLT